MTLKIVSWNIWYGKYFDQILTFLKKEDADIVCLQEIVAKKGATTNTASKIAKELGYKDFVFDFALEIEKEGEKLDWGNAILSKFPITASKTHSLSEGANRRIALLADIKVGEKTLHTMTTHLIHTHQQESPVRNEQADRLIESLPKGPTILTGDFNALPQSYPIKKTSEVLVNTNNEETPTFSLFPEGCCPDKMKYRLDYIFISSDIKLTSFEVGDSKGSDHLPITANLEL